MKNTILLADESENISLPLPEITADYRLRRVTDGLSALEACDTFIPDLALISLDLPEMNGFEVCEAMVQNPDLQHTVLVALLDSDSQEQRSLARSAGFHYCFRRPISRKALQRLLAHDRLADPVAGPAAVSFSLHS